MKGKYKDPSMGKKSDGSKTPYPSNHGATTGLRQEAGTNQGATKKPSTRNPYPDGLA